MSSHDEVSASRSGSSVLMGAAAILAGIVVVMNLFKVSASMSLLVADLGIDPSMGGWLITVCNIMAVVLVLPGGSLADRFGPKRIGLFGLVCACVGSVAGGFCTDVGLLIATRVVEGVGYAFTAVVSPAIIAAAFPPEKRGIPMAIWSCWMGIGTLVILNVANFFIDPQQLSSWTNLWWFCAALLAIVVVFYALAVKEPKREEVAEGASSVKVSLAASVKSPSTWIIAIVFFAFNAGLLSLLSLAPVYCQTNLGLSAAEANTYTSLLTVGMIVGGFIMSAVLAKLTSLRGRIVFLAVSMAFTAVVFGWAYIYSLDQIVPFMLIGGLVLAAMPAVGFTIAPETASSPAYAGTAIGVFLLLGNLAGFGSPLVGSMMEQSSATVAIMLFVINAVGAVLSLALLKTMKDRM